MNRYAVLFYLFIAEFGASLVLNNFAPVLPITSREWSLTGAMAGSILAAFFIGYFIFVIPLGSLSDKFGGRIVFSLCALWAGIAGLAFSIFANDFNSALVLRMLGGIGVWGLYVPGLRILTNWFLSYERGKAISIFTFSNFAAGAGGYYIGGPLLLLHSLRDVKRYFGHLYGRYQQLCSCILL